MHCGLTVRCACSNLCRRYAGSTARTIAPLVVGIVLLLIATANEIFTSRSPIVPPRLFKVSLYRLSSSAASPLTRRLACAVSCRPGADHRLHPNLGLLPCSRVLRRSVTLRPCTAQPSSRATDLNLTVPHCMLRTGAFYLPVYFQVLGSSATGAGVRYVSVFLQ